MPELQKATIKKHIPEGETIQVLFNPSQYQLTRGNQFAEVAVPGLGAPPLQFVRGNARTLSMQLFFDTYDPVDASVTQGSDVRQYTQQIISLLEVDSELHAPPICLFNWGSLSFVGVLERADQTFTMFLSTGIPVRATMAVSLKEVGQEQSQAGRLQSAHFTKRHVVRRGDTLSSIAAEKHGDPALWRPIAEENDLDNPLALQTGQVLVIPALV
jgi:LysM repeat protein